jgi:hypothetical protein
MSVQSLSTNELAERWGVTATHLRRQRMEGNGPPYFRPSGGDRGHVRYRLQDVIEYEKERSRVPTGKKS